MSQIKVLDHGFVALRNIAGPTRRTEQIVREIEPQYVVPRYTSEERPFDADDIDPANAARMSFDAMDKTHSREDDLKLAEFLMKNRHTTPFEMIEVWIEMKMPIFVARQFVRHRTVSINEVSARYITLPAEWYVPDPRTVGVKQANIKQGRVIDEAPPSPVATLFCSDLETDCRSSYDRYTAHLNAGIPPELARCFLHVNHYTHWLWKQDLHNLMHFLSLRAHGHAQFEAQAYGFAIIDLLRVHLPHSMALFDKYRRQEVRS